MMFSSMKIALVSVSLLAAAPAAAELDETVINPDLRSIARVIYRAQENKLAYTPPKIGPLPVGVIERTIAGASGQPPVTIYIVNASTLPSSPKGIIYYIHGGGFVGGDARENLKQLKELAVRLDSVVVTVQYRLAPATRFPGPLEDAYSGLRWVHKNAAELGGDPSRIVVMGESAGGGLAAMLTFAARDRAEVKVAFQALIYPMLDDRTGSSRTVPPHIGQIIWTSKSNRNGWRALLGRKPGAERQPAGSVPARVGDLKGLPPTFIGVGAIDLFVEEDIDFARRLIASGVPTELLVVPGAFHGFQLIAPQAPVSKQFNATLEAALARALGSEKKP